MRKKIKKVSVAPIDPIEGAVSDTLNVTDKVKNAPSINLVQQMTGIPQEGVIAYEGEGVPEGYEEVANPDKIVQVINLSEIINFASGFSALDGTIFRDRNRYFGTLTIHKASGAFSNDTVLYFTKPIKGYHNTGCWLTYDQWNSQAVGYCFMGTDSMIISDPNNAHGIAKVTLDIVVAD